MGWLAVGIRGENRQQRHGAVLQERDVLSYRTPESLVAEQAWNRSSHSISVAAVESLRLVADLAASEGIPWGVAGSVGYELATGSPVTMENSDLDIILRVQVPVLSSLQRFYEKLSMAPCRVDALIETPMGAASLEEFVRCPERSLIKTDSGVHLCALEYYR
ncbi:MAG: phosphoribosyl-dephospho-CoA transferase [Acidobacteriaceae bacterium]|nr:phosphoribosyl-dephospho-CoA transferase [Acidobacteriaceae bacterium]